MCTVSVACQTSDIIPICKLNHVHRLIHNQNFFVNIAYAGLKDHFIIQLLSSLIFMMSHILAKVHVYSDLRLVKNGLIQSSLHYNYSRHQHPFSPCRCKQRESIWRLSIISTSIMGILPQTLKPGFWYFVDHRCILCIREQSTRLLVKSK